jgi:1-acyl-sn-glycerol-3-phosphate acyltransferase
MRKAITAFLRFCLKVFYRRIEFSGLDRVPDGPVIFAINHPNGLVDPLFVLCFAPRPVSFLAKAPLFRYPVIGWFARMFEGIPVYRKQDQTRGSNQETFARARQVLRNGGSIAIFPEGTTHSDPQLRELKTGVARIALGAGLDELFVVPTGIYYTAKHVFRSEAMAVFGEAVRVPRALGSSVPREDEPPADEVETLTAAIDEGLDAVTLQAESQAALELIARAEDIFTADETQPLVEELELRRRFIEGYQYLRAHDPERLARLESAIARLAAELRRMKLDPHDLAPRLDPARVRRIVILLPLALIGAIPNWPAYRLIGFIARRLSKGEGAMIATIKFLAAFALYPLTWIALATFIGLRFGAVWAIASLIVVPILGYIALRVFEDIDDVIGDVRGLMHAPRLSARREAIRQEILAVAQLLASVPD